MKLDQFCDYIDHFNFAQIIGVEKSECDLIVKIKSPHPTEDDVSQFHKIKCLKPADWNVSPNGCIECISIEADHPLLFKYHSLMDEIFFESPPQEDYDEIIGIVCRIMYEEMGGLDATRGVFGSCDLVEENKIKIREFTKCACENI